MNTFFTITAKNIQVLRGCCYATARKEWRSILDAKGARQLSLRELAAHWDVPVKELAEILYKPAKRLN